MRGDIQKVIFLFFLVLTNMLSIMVISLDIPRELFLNQLFIVLSYFLVYSLIIILLVNKSLIGKIVLAILFISFLADVIYLLKYSQSNILAVICIVSVLGAIMSFFDIKHKRRLSMSKINPKKTDRKSEIDKELNDEWNKKPGLIYDDD